MNTREICEWVSHQCCDTRRTSTQFSSPDVIIPWTLFIPPGSKGRSSSPELSRQSVLDHRLLLSPMSELAFNLARLAKNWTNLGVFEISFLFILARSGLFQIIFQYILALRTCQNEQKIDLKNSQICRIFLPIWPFLEPNLPSVITGGISALFFQLRAHL